MKRVRDFSLMFDRLIVSVLAVVIIGVLGVLAASVVRQSGMDEEFQQSLDELQDTSADLQDTMEQLRSSSDDPDILLNLDEIDEKLESVSDQLEMLEQAIDEPLLAVGGDETEAAALADSQSSLARALTLISWMLGGVSIVTAIVLAVVLRRRWTGRRRRLLHFDYDARRE